MNLTEPSQSVWDRAVDTLAGMCLSDKLGHGPDKRAFISTLRLYADQLEKLLPCVANSDENAQQDGSCAQMHDNEVCDSNPGENEKQDPCPRCGSLEAPYFSRSLPMGYYCPSCGLER